RRWSPMRRLVSMDPVGILNAWTMKVRMKVARMKATTSDSRYSRATDFLKGWRGAGADAMRRHSSSAQARGPEPAPRIEALLHRPADLAHDLGRVAVVEGLVVGADAVLGAEAPPEPLHGQGVDPRLQLGLELGGGAGRVLIPPDEVEVDPAV